MSDRSPIALPETRTQGARWDAPTAYRNYLLAVLLVTLAFNNVDRLALGLVLEDLKADFHLSDTQLGLLSGIAFALFYSVMGIPIARWADRGNRVTIISLTAALWSAGVVLCGMAASFLQLLLIRIGVAVGEAGCMPPAHSLIADHFSRAERPRAVAIYMMGAPLSMAIGYFLAGALNQRYGWRMMFVMLGVPGLALAALAWLTLREPRRLRASATASAATAAAPAHSLKQVLVTLWRNATFRCLWCCFSVTCFFGYGLVQWQPTFFIRSFGVGTGELGAWFALIYGLGGLAGTYLGGMLASRYATNNEPLQLKAMGFMFAGFGFCMAGIFLSPDKNLAFGLTAVAAIGGNMTNGPLFATIQTLVPERMRAMAMALIYLFGNLIGLGLGPLAVGALSDAFRPWGAGESLRYALLALCPGYLWGAWYLWRASRTVTRDLEAVMEPART